MFRELKYAARVLDELLYGVAPRDPVTLAIVVIVSVGLSATLIPR